MLATFFLGLQPFGPPKMSLVLRPPVAWSLILRTGQGGVEVVHHHHGGGGGRVGVQGVGGVGGQGEGRGRTLGGRAAGRSQGQ